MFTFIRKTLGVSLITFGIVLFIFIIVGTIAGILSGNCTNIPIEKEFYDMGEAIFTTLVVISLSIGLGFGIYPSKC